MAYEISPKTEHLKVPLNDQQEAAISGYAIPYLPDFLADHTLLGNSPHEHLQEVLGRFERLVIGLRKFPNSAYALRFISRPERGAVDIYLLNRILRQPEGNDQVASWAGADLGVHLKSYGFAFKALTHQPQEKEGIPALDQVCRPFQGRISVIEIRQHEELVPFMVAGRSAYSLHPWWGPTGALLEPFEALLQQPVPVAISVYLEPTELSRPELDSLFEAAHIAQTYSDVNINVQSQTGIGRRRDPGAEMVGRVYAAYTQSLSEPFVTLVQVVSPDPNAAWTVARSYASGMTTARTDLDPQNSMVNALPSGTDFATPANQAEGQRALQSFEKLVWSPWGETLAQGAQGRLRYLAGARGASTAFRFPVSVQGGVPGIAVRQIPPDFAPGPRPEQAAEDELHLGFFRNGGAATARLKELTRHTLITGFTGSGKTNTVLYLLDQLWHKHRIPFLVIESAKKEYRALARVRDFDDLLVFSLGDETTSPFRLNPFELLPGVRVEAHIGRLQECFDAALPQFGILPSIVAQSLEEIYKDKGWKLTDRMETGDARLFPTLRDMLNKVIQVAEERGYAGETFHNIRAAAAGRIGNLLRGSRGRMFGGQRSFPADLIFTSPVILELNDLNQDDKALTMMFLLTWLREYRELHPDKTLQHLTVVEEAHNVVSNVQSVGASEISADTKAKAVAAFSDMLSEVRSYGEGLMISDQSPEKLAPDAMRNTNLQLAHQLRDRRDREAIARAMIMDESQQEFLGKLRIGEAALFKTGIEKATFIQVPEYKDSAGFDQPPSDEYIHNRMEDFQRKYLTATLPFDGCRFCGAPCDFREAIEPYSLEKEKHEQLMKALKRFDQQPEKEHWPSHWRAISGVCAEVAEEAGYPHNLEAAYCYLAHEIDFPFTEHMRRAIEIAHREIGEGG